MDARAAADGIDAYLRQALSAKRLAHSLSCAEMARRLAERHGIDPWATELAALSHDMAKGLPEEEQLELAETCHRSLLAGGKAGLCDELLENPKLRHGPAAEVLLGRDFKVGDPDVLEAVRWHTLGHPRMGKMARIVFIADKIEDCRKDVKDAFRRECLSSALDRALLLVIGRSMEYLASCGRAVAPVTLSLYNSLLETEE